MENKDYLDYILYQSSNGEEQTIFRFNTKLSSCHSFNDQPPKNWEGVYKVYYYYQIIEMNTITGNIEKVLFDSHCDECSELYEIAERCKYLAQGKKQVKITRDDRESKTLRLLNQEIMPFGMGVSWTIRQPHQKFRFEIFNWWDEGYRFWIPKKEIGQFGEYLQSCCEYMLAHGVPI